MSRLAGEIDIPQLADAARFRGQLLCRLYQGYVARNRSSHVEPGPAHRAAELVSAEQSKDASPQFPTLFPAASFAGLDVLTWNNVVPRFGLAWDVADRTIVKATFGRFVNGMDDGFANAYNSGQHHDEVPVARSEHQRRLRPGRGELDTGASGRFHQCGGASSAKLNPELRAPMTNEATLGVEREVAEPRRSRAVRVQEGHRPIYDAQRRASAQRLQHPADPPRPWTGRPAEYADDGGTVTIYDYDPRIAGAAFVKNEQQNTDREGSVPDDRVHRDEANVEQVGRDGVFLGHQVRCWLPDQTNPTMAPLHDDPNVAQNGRDETWKWAGNFSGNIWCRGVFNSARSSRARWACSGSGQRLPCGRSGWRKSAGSAGYGGTENGAERSAEKRRHQRGEPARQQVRLDRWCHRVEFDFDLFNVFNSSAPITANFQSGPTFGYATSVVPPRIARLGVKYSF